MSLLLLLLLLEYVFMDFVLIGKGNGHLNSLTHDSIGMGTRQANGLKFQADPMKIFRFYPDDVYQ